MNGIGLRLRKQTGSPASLNQGPDDGDFASYVEDLTNRSVQNAAAAASAASTQQQESSGAVLDSDDWGRGASGLEDSTAQNARVEKVAKVTRDKPVQAESKLRVAKAIQAITENGKAQRKSDGALRMITLIKWGVVLFFVLPWLFSLLMALLK